MTTERAGIPAKYKWDLSAIYPDEAAFSAEFSETERMIAEYPKHESTMLSRPEALAAALADHYAIDRKMAKLYEYAARNFDVDTSVNSWQAQTAKVINLSSRFMAAAYFVVPYLLKLDAEKLEQWYLACPELQKYRRVIEVELRRKPYVLSDECEKLLAGMSQGLDSHDGIYSILTDCDMQFGKIRDEEGRLVELTDSSYLKFLMSQNRRVRRAAFTKLYRGYEQFGNTIATVLNGFIKEKATLAKLREYESSLFASTFADEVTPEIYNNLIDTVNRNLEVLFDYYDLKREVLGLPKLHMYDAYAPLIADYDRDYTYEEARDEVLEAVKIFGDEYYQTLKAGMTEWGWVDVYPNKGKRGGAYSSGSYDTEPYILLNFNGKFDDMSTLAHEAGHSMHSYFSRKNNEFHLSNYNIFVAEVASTVNELVLATKKLRESENDLEKLSVLNHIMETFKGTLFRQTMFAEFERDIYALVEANEPLTREILCEKYYAIVKKYFGPRVVVDQQISMEWMRIPHFYYNFYVYKYATCISAASSVMKKIAERGDEYIRKYIDFLKCGNSKSPIESLMIAEIDMTRPEVVEDAVSVFADTVKQFREIAGRLGMIKSGKN
ncbi:MAG TPA: oligoendopeptidase F [Clostridiales bacterium]|jgi:oligoendopeptidase F|nr:oligoendopeptidase F [Clostridiales bacterium]